ncbi:RloB family protein [Wukongibacter sp. M2B1]|uniref:RloB family protein n=1 Tax=Wukongibacter sp. M2B1 TaxID=3088895 RepID=UPI003D78EC71
MNERIKLVTGRNTLSLLDYAKTVVVVCEHIWLVYDLDDFPLDNFDNTAYSVESMNENNNTSTKWHVAWSNQCIEIWFLLHFNYYNSDIHRTEYFEKLSDIFKEYELDKYEKNNEDIFEILIQYGNLEDAINNAKRLYKENEGQPPSKIAPATKVYELVEILKPHML